MQTAVLNALNGALVATNSLQTNEAECANQIVMQQSVFENSMQSQSQLWGSEEQKGAKGQAIGTYFFAVLMGIMGITAGLTATSASEPMASRALGSGFAQQVGRVNGVIGNGGVAISMGITTGYQHQAAGHQGETGFFKAASDSFSTDSEDMVKALEQSMQGNEAIAGFESNAITNYAQAL